MSKEKTVYLNGNEAAAFAAKQIDYHVAGYFPITPSTQVVETLDIAHAKGEHHIRLIGAEGEHSAAGICYGASACGARVLNATSANGLLYALEQLPVQSGTRMPMVLNVACRAVSAPLSIKGDHSDIMFALNTGWIILFATCQQEVYDFNVCAVKIAEQTKLPVIVAYDGFFTSHQKCKFTILEKRAVQKFVGKPVYEMKLLDLKNPKTIGAYMNEPYLINNKYQLRLAMEEAENNIKSTFNEYESLSGRAYESIKQFHANDADYIMFALGSSYHTIRIAVKNLREKKLSVGAFTLLSLRPFPAKEIAKLCENAKAIIILDRQDSFSASGGNMTAEIKSALYDSGCKARIYSRIYGLGGIDFYASDAEEIFMQCISGAAKSFDYFGQYSGNAADIFPSFANPIPEKETSPALDSFSAMAKRLAPGHSACPGCGIPVNVNLLLSAVPGNVVLLFQTGCGMVVTTCYPKTAFRVPYIHNLFQNGPAVMAGILAAFHEMQQRGEYPEGRITFIMVSGDGGMDIGMGCAIASALRNDGFILFEYDNGGYMNTGYQHSYSTPKGALSATSHAAGNESKTSYKNTPFILAASGASYVATAAECNVPDFRKKAKKAYHCTEKGNFAYIKALSACPLNWGDSPSTERQNIEAAVNSCYFPLYEIDNGKITVTYNPEKSSRKCDVSKWFSYMKRTRYLLEDAHSETLKNIQADVDKRWNTLLSLAEWSKGR